MYQCDTLYKRFTAAGIVWSRSNVGMYHVVHKDQVCGLTEKADKLSLFEFLLHQYKGAAAPFCRAIST